MALRYRLDVSALVKQCVRSVSKLAILKRMSYRLAAVPALGLIPIAPAKKQWLALRDSSITVICGAIGIWLPLAFRYGIDSQATFEANVSMVALRGEIFVLVPSLVAPLYILAGVLKNNRRVRRHQIALVMAALVFSFVALFFWARIYGRTSVDFWLGFQSCVAFVGTYFLLYLYYLLVDLPDAVVLERFKESGKSLTSSVVQRRTREGK